VPSAEIKTISSKY